MKRSYKSSNAVKSHSASHHNDNKNVSRNQFNSLNSQDNVEINADYYGDDSDKGPTIVTNYFYLNK